MVVSNSYYCDMIARRPLYFLGLALTSIFTLTNATVSTLFKASTNISASNFGTYTKKITYAESNIICAHHCAYWETKSSLCNTYNYDKDTKKCQLARLSFLENPAPGLYTIPNYRDKFINKYHNQERQVSQS